ncbi:unnamed protein product, partial [Laminaria digitata]
MKFLRRESERGDFETKSASTKRVMDSFQASPVSQQSSVRQQQQQQQQQQEPTPVVVTTTAAPSVISESSSITMQTPDNVIGETLVVQGRVEFQNLLRIDGHFEGELVGNGSLIIGPTAEVISNLRGLNEVYVEGILIGDCVCNKMQIRFAGCVTGNLQCASLGMDPSVVLKGSANVNPRDKTDKGKSSRSTAPRHNKQRSQPRASSDETSSSSRASTSIPSPESVSSRAPGYEDDKGIPTKQKSRSRGSGEVGGGGGSHGRGSSSESTASSV